MAFLGQVIICKGADNAIDNSELLKNEFEIQLKKLGLHKEFQVIIIEHLGFYEKEPIVNFISICSMHKNRCSATLLSSGWNI